MTVNEILDRAREEQWTELAFVRGDFYLYLLRDRGWDITRCFAVNDQEVDPGRLAQCTSLNKLFVYGLGLGTEGARAIASLAFLTALDLGLNGIGDEGARAIASLPSLTSLRLAVNEIGDEGARAIASLTSLTSLDLSGNNIGPTGARGVASLRSLTHLCLNHNGIRDEGARAVATLPGLTSLVLYSSSIGDEGARAIASLTTLKSLDIAANNIGPDGARAIASLPALDSLDLSFNMIGPYGTRAIVALASLNSLDLAHNDIGPDGARAVAVLTSLTSLGLGGNDVGDEGARAIASLDSLIDLSLSNNGIGDEGARALLEQWAKTGTRRSLNLTGNAITILPEELLARGDAQAILAAYRRLQASTTAALNEAKLLVVGREAVGKTSLVRFLVHGKHRDPDEQRTPGIAHQRIERQPWIAQANGPVLNVWDFGGQEIMYETHKFFLTARSIYLLVLEDRREDDRSIFDWLRTIANRGGDSPVIVVINKCDNDSAKLLIDEATIMRDHPTVVGFVRTSCNDSEHARRSIERLQQKIVETLANDPRLAHVRDPIATPWRQVKNQLAELAGREKVVSQHDFIRLCMALQGTDAITDEHEQRGLLGLLHDLGVIVAHGLRDDDPAALQNVRLLDPNWLTGAIYRVLTSGLVVQQGGVFRREQLAELLDPTDYPRDRWEFILSMMQLEGVGLTFLLPNSTTQEYLVPEALPVNTPAYDNWPKDSLRFRFDYELLPRGLIPRFLVEAHTRLTNSRWRTGAVLDAASCKVLVKGDLDRKRIDIWVDGPEGMRRSALNVILEDLQRVHALNPESKPTAKVPLPDNPDVDVGYQYLLRLEELKGSSYEFLPDGATREYRVSELLNGVRMRSEPPGERKPSPRALARRVEDNVVAAKADAEGKLWTAQAAKLGFAAAIITLIGTIIGLLNGC